MAPTQEQIAAARQYWIDNGIAAPSQQQIDTRAGELERMERQGQAGQSGAQGQQQGTPGDDRDEIRKAIQSLAKSADAQSKALEAKEREKGKQTAPDWTTDATAEETEAVSAIGQSGAPSFLLQRLLLRKDVPLSTLRQVHLTSTYLKLTDPYTKSIKNTSDSLSLWTDLIFADGKWDEFLPSLNTFVLLVKDARSTKPDDWPQQAVDMIVAYQGTIVEMWMTAHNDTEKIDVLLYDILSREILTKAASGSKVNIGDKDEKRWAKAIDKRREMSFAAASGDEKNVYSFLPKSSKYHPLHHLSTPSAGAKRSNKTTKAASSSSSPYPNKSFRDDEATATDPPTKSKNLFCYTCGAAGHEARSCPDHNCTVEKGTLIVDGKRRCLYYQRTTCNYHGAKCRNGQHLCAICDGPHAAKQCPNRQ